MKDSFTLNDLILLSNNEKKSGPVVDQENWSNALPDERIVSNLIRYSQALNVIKTQNAGNFKLLMN